MYGKFMFSVTNTLQDGSLVKNTINMEEQTMKKLITVIAASLTLGAFAFAEGYISANDVKAGIITGQQKEEDGFIIEGSGGSKPIEVKKTDSKTCDGETITQRIGFGGSGSANGPYISFPAKAGETITIYANHSGTSGNRPLKLVTADGAAVEEFSNTSYKGDVGVFKIKAPKTDTFKVFPSGGGAYIYMIKVSK